MAGDNGEMEYPTSRYSNSRKDEAKRGLLSVVEEFKEILKSELHPDNKSPAYKKRSEAVFNKLAWAANALDRADEEPGAGIFSLIILSLRSNVYLKEEVVRMRKELKDLRLDVKKMKAGKKNTSKKA